MGLDKLLGVLKEGELLSLLFKYVFLKGKPMSQRNCVPFLLLPFLFRV